MISARWPIPVIYANIVFNWNVLSDFILVKFFMNVVFIKIKLALDLNFTYDRFISNTVKRLS